MLKPNARPSCCSALKGKHSIVVIEHDMEFIRRLGQKVTVLVQGHVMKEGSARCCLRG